MRFHWKMIGLPCLMHIHDNEILLVKFPTVCLEFNGIKYCGCRLCNVLHTLLLTMVWKWYSLKPCSHCPGVLPGSSTQFVAGAADRGEPGRIVNELGCVHTFPHCYGQTRFGGKCDHGRSRLCYGLRRCFPGVAPEALRCVPVRSETPRLCPGHRRRAPVSLRRVMEVGRQNPVVTR